uniref:site-specific DNA-methyltransferase (adenine-specific) n=1 Tax=Geobacillus stearothermophilus TaxID=1422 RepID=E5Q8U4_GEOSE|nr:M1.BsrBI [Geobacillus stearothermophilus]
MATKTPIPFRYPGGKYYALNILKPYWTAINHDEYREPFVGGGSVFFAKNKVKFNWLNDIDSELIATYEVMSNPELREKLVEMLSKEEASKERWKEILEFKPSNKLEIAYRYYYLNRTSFSGKLSSPAWGYRPKRSLPPERWHERIIPCGQKLEGVKITNEDFESVIKAPKQGNHVLLFVDPPYYKPPKTKHYRNGFSLDDHIRLANILKETEHSFFLTYDDVPEIRELYSWAYIHEAAFFYRVDNSSVQAGKRRLGFELIITNYEMSEQIKLF